MSQLSQASPQTGQMLRRIAILVVGDGLAFLMFVLVGRSSHGLSLGDFGALLWTAAPFLLGWFLVAPWFGLFSEKVSRAWRQLLPRLSAAWVLLGGPLALIFWALLRGRPIIGGIVPTFALITLIFTTLFLLGWRLGYCWWANRGLN